MPVRRLVSRKTHRGISRSASDELSRVVKIGRNLKSELVEPLFEFLKKNLDIFAWTHANMVGIHPDIMCHNLNIDPQAKLVRRKQKALDVDRYQALQEKVDRLLKIGVH